MSNTTIIEPLTQVEQSEFQHCEEVIGTGLKVFWAVGEALAAISEKRLYRQQYATFEDYCRERWQISRPRAYQLIRAAAVVENMSTNGRHEGLPLNERQARELSALTPGEQRLVWEVVKQTAPDGNVTAGHLKSVVEVTKELIVTGAIDDGSGEQIAVSEIAKAAITEGTYERMKRQEAYIQQAHEKKEARVAEKKERETVLLGKKATVAALIVNGFMTLKVDDLPPDLLHKGETVYITIERRAPAGTSTAQAVF